MDKYTEARFGEYRKKSLDDLLTERESLLKEIDDILRDLDDRNTPSYEKTDLRNDLKYAKEKLEYIEYLIEQFSFENGKTR